MQKILSYVQNPLSPIKITEPSKDAEQNLQALTIDKALGGLKTFKKLLHELNDLSPEYHAESQQIEAPSRTNSWLPSFTKVQTVTGVLGAIAVGAAAWYMGSDTQSRPRV